MAINFISSKDSDKIRTMVQREIIQKLLWVMKQMKLLKNFLNLFLQKYQERLEEKMRGSEFVFDSIDLLHCNIHKISLNRGGSYIDSPKWLENKKATINPKNNDDNAFSML